MDNLFSKQTLAVYFAIWKQMKAGEDLDDDVVLIADSMKAHPEFDAFWPQGEAALNPQEVDGFVVNPLIHTGLHVEIEKQLINQQTEGLSLALDALLAKGLERHEAIHQIAGIWADIYFRAIRQGAPFDDWAYAEALRALVRVTEI